jgi:hypothetical protein
MHRNMGDPPKLSVFEVCESDRVCHIELNNELLNTCSTIHRSPVGVATGLADLHACI